MCLSTYIFQFNIVGNIPPTVRSIAKSVRLNTVEICGVDR